ncbi:hypothetical protein EV700_2234 [Fluviicoccus keumensis]|uniref:Uncharacterized protein n=1 Tax=Fluviicoccus keumensis TaxID=1435465 RepID=A0A4Q7YMV5_9GAMM|nr:hypothetical protein [Fluviicoccus keumensis]RZU38304.1 hypothetical protein EV700_2234 [Fluviicoccus keumensis]
MPLAALLLWLPALSGPFQFDDYNVIVDQPAVHSLDAWRRSLPGIRPLLKLSYSLNWVMSPAAFGFHLANLLIHALNGLLLYAWLGRTGRFAPPLSLIITLLWFLHPAQTEAVTYIAGRSVSLSATALLAGLVLLTGHHPHRAALAAVCTLAGLAVRETAWIFPATFALTLWLQGHERRDIARLLTPTLIVVGLAAIVFVSEPHFRRLIDVSLATRTPGEQWLAQIEAWRYFVTGPLRLTPNIDPDLPVPVTATAAHLWWGAGWLLSAGLAVWGTLARRSWAAGGVLWFLLLLVPTNSLMPRLDVASDRHLYPALIGLAWSAAVLLQPWRGGRVLLWLMLPLLAVALLIRNEDYRSATALWARTAEQSPSKSRVWNNLGIACQREGRPDCARAAFTEAWRLDPGNRKAGANLYFLERPVAPP